MANIAGVIKAALDIDVSSVRRAMQDVRRQMRDAFGRSTQNDIRNLGRSMQEVSNHAKDMGNHLKSVERIVGGILISQVFYQMAGQIGAAGAALYDFMGQMDKAEIAFENFLDGNNEKAKAFIYNMQDFAAETSFDTGQANQLSMQLMAAQFNPKEIRSMMEVLNDAAAGSGTGAEAIDRIVYAMNQIKTKGKLMAEELRQLANANIPIYKILAEQLGITEEKLTDIGELNISGDLGVAALLQGLEKQYKGTAERISNTVPGLVANIKDNLLVLGDALLRGPFEALGRNLKVVRENLDDMRETLANKGLGGLFVEVFGEETTQQIRVVVAGVMSLIDSFKKVTTAVMPVAKVLGSMLLSALSSVIPAIARVVNMLADIISVALQVVPPLKYLIAAIAGLSIAFAAGRALVFLWTITGAGLICSTVAKAVLLLRNAIYLLFAVIGKSKILMAISLLVTIIMGVALASGKAAQWVDALTKKLQNLMGLSTKDILQPTDLNMADMAEEFNDAYNSVKDVTDATADSGKEADKTAKKYKKWLASFDEVFQVPEPEDSDKDKDEVNAPDFAIPKLDLGKLDIDDNPLEDKPIKIPFEFDFPDIGPWIRNLKTNIGNPIPIDFKFNFEWARALATSMEGLWADLTDWLKELKRRLGEGLGALQPQLQPGFGEVLHGVLVGSIVTTFPLVQAAWQNLLEVMKFPDISANFRETVSTFPNTIADWIAEVGGVFQTEFPKLQLGVTTMATNLAMTVLSAFGPEKLVPISTYFASFGAIVSTAASSIGTTASNMGVVLSTAFTAGLGVVGGFFSNALQAVTNGLSSVASAVGGFFSSQGLAVGAGLAAIISLVGTFIGSVSKGIGGLFSASLAGGVKFFASFGNTFSTGLSGILTKIISFITGSGSSWTKWLGNLLAGVKGLVTKLTPSWSGMMTVLSTAAKTGWEAVTKFFKDHKSIILTVVELLITGVTMFFTGGLSGIVLAVVRFGPKVLKVFTGLLPAIRTGISNLPKIFDDVIGAVIRIVPGLVSKIASPFKNLPTAIWEGIKSIPEMVMGIFSKIKLPSFSALASGVKATFAPIGNLVGFENGGIIGQDSIVRVGEKGRREAIIPLQNDQAMQPFVNSVVKGLRGSDLGSGSRQQSSDGGSDKQVLYVGNLIADDRSLRELERRMRVVRLDEDKRGKR